MATLNCTAAIARRQFRQRHRLRRTRSPAAARSGRHRRSAPRSRVAYALGIADRLRVDRGRPRSAAVRRRPTRRSSPRRSPSPTPSASTGPAPTCRRWRTPSCSSSWPRAGRSATRIRPPPAPLRRRPSRPPWPPRPRQRPRRPPRPRPQRRPQAAAAAAGRGGRDSPAAAAAAAADDRQRRREDQQQLRWRAAPGPGRRERGRLQRARRRRHHPRRHPGQRGRPRRSPVRARAGLHGAARTPPSVTRSSRTTSPTGTSWAWSTSSGSSGCSPRRAAPGGDGEPRQPDGQPHGPRPRELPRLTGMRVLVTGSAGHLGEALVRTLRRSGHDVVGLDLLDSPHTDAVASVTDRRVVREVIAGADAVLHTATLHKPHVAVPRPAGVRGHQRHRHAGAPGGGGRRRRRCVRLHQHHERVRPGADAGGGEPAAWITEDVVPRPRNIYGVTKVAAEDLCELVRA